MSKMIQIRNVPDDLHRTLKAKAAAQGLTLSDYLLQMAEREARRVSWDEMSRRIERHGRPLVDVDIAEIVREMRGPLPD
jgi:plasmid stability protein